MHTNGKTIGNTIRRLRKENGVTQEELAEAIGVTPQAVSKWENGAGMPDVSQLVPLANYFRVSMDTLFDRESDGTDEQVTALVRELEASPTSAYDKFERYAEALRIYPNHPRLLRGMVQSAEHAITAEPTPRNSRLLTAGLRAAEQYIRREDHPLYTVRVKESRIRLLARAGRYAEAEEYAREFAVPLLSEHSLLAHICREQQDFPAEIRHRQESITRLAVALADEISQLGKAYRQNGQYAEATEAHAINLRLPYTLHGEGVYHAPLLNFHAISGFDAAYCLLLSNRQEDALTLLEHLFDYAEEQCPYSTNSAPLSAPLFQAIDATPFHGECRVSDYLHRIRSSAFEPLHSHPRFQALLARYEAYTDKP